MSAQTVNNVVSSINSPINTMVEFYQKLAPSEIPWLKNVGLVTKGIEYATVGIDASMNVMQQNYVEGGINAGISLMGLVGGPLGSVVSTEMVWYKQTFMFLGNGIQQVNTNGQRFFINQILIK